MPIGFHRMVAASEAKTTNLMMNGLFMATSARSLISIQTDDTREPIFISPKAHAELLAYCEKHI